MFYLAEMYPVHAHYERVPSSDARATTLGGSTPMNPFKLVLVACSALTVKITASGFSLARATGLPALSRGSGKNCSTTFKQMTKNEWTPQAEG